MGLDMYLKCNHRELVEEVFGKRVEWGYVSEDSWHRSGGYICYWRKANMIHNWFVENVQENEDDCKIYEVGLDILAELRDVCRNVLHSSKLVKDGMRKVHVIEDGRFVEKYQDYYVIEDPSIAIGLLPTTTGFFFGSTTYDEDYYRDVEETYRTLDFILSKFTPREDGFYGWEQTYGDTDWVVQFSYHASW